MALTSNSIKKNFVFSLSGNFLSSLCQWGLIILLARITDASTLGVYGLAGAVATPFYAFFSLRARQYLITDVGQEYSTSQYFQIRFFTSTLALLCTALVAFTYSSVTVEQLAILLIGISKFAESISDIYQAVFQHRERLDYYAKSVSLCSIFNLIGFGIALLLFNDLLVALTGLIISRIIMLIVEARWITIKFKDSSFFSIFKTNWDWPLIWNFTKKASPLGLMTLLVSLNTNISRYFLEYFHGVESLGIFTAVSYFMYAGTTLCTALAQSSAPQLAKRYKLNDPQFYPLLLSLLAFATGIALLGIFASYYFGEYILVMVYGPDFSGQSYVLTLFMIAAGFMYIYGYLSIVITAMRYLKAQGVLSVVSLTASSTACYFLIPELKIVGAAYATLIGSFVYFVGASAVISSQLLKNKRQ